MQDYNFFSSYKTKRKARKGTGTLLMVLTFVLFIFVSGGVIGFKFFQVVRLEAELILLRESLAAVQTGEELMKIEEKQLMLNDLILLKDNLNSVPDMLARNPISPNTFADILTSLPADVQLLNITLAQEQIFIDGKAGIQSAIAEFQYTLRQTIAADSISVMSINRIEEEDTEEYAFMLAITLGGDENEGQ